MKDNSAVRHKNIPIFIPHLGCPHDCVFCNQKKISGHSSFDTSRVRAEIEEALSTVSAGEQAEIAFFGGSFTGIDRQLMITLLNIAEEYVRGGRVIGIRMSTRPDYIDTEILDILRGYTVSAIELGLQSFDDEVLRASERGHTSADSVRACHLIKEYGFELVGQMMIGLPGASAESELETARMIVSLGCSAARVYPTVVFRSTKLCRMAEKGEYTVLSDEETVRRTSDVLEILIKENITLLRVGLCSNEDIRDPDEVYGGAVHPAIGELCIGELYYKLIREQLISLCENSRERIPSVEVYVSHGSTGKAVGHKKINKERFYNEFCKSGRIGKIKILESAHLRSFETEIKISYK